MSLSAPRSFGPAVSASFHPTGALDILADGEIFDTPNAKPQSLFFSSLLTTAAQQRFMDRQISFRRSFTTVLPYFCDFC
jgi:hypothetical protein